MKIKLHSIYNDPSFTCGRKPEFIEWSENEGELDCYVDSLVYTVGVPKKSIALLIEPRSIQPEVYDYIENSYMKFKYVFTHDSKLLEKLDNAKRILFGGVYAIYNKPKTGNISICSSNKEMCKLHIVRTDLCHKLKNNPKVDCFGTYDEGKWATTEQIYAPYKYNIVIENYQDDYWFTEKLCNCFANRVVPIYYGARKISEFFNPLGIIQIDNPYDAIEVIDKLDCNKDYLKRLPGIIANYELVKRFYCFEDWFHNEYMDLLKEVADGKD